MTSLAAYQEFVRRAFVYNQGTWRLGQTYYNVLFDMHHKLAEEAGDDPTIDPFYEDANIERFLTWLGMRWPG